MPAEGMVRALEIIWRFLESDGLLIDIHPTGEPPAIEVVHGEQRFLVGHLQETDGFIEYFQATATLDQAIENGWFSLESRSEFVFTMQAGSMAELHTFLDENWSDAVLLPEIERRGDEIIAQLIAQGKQPNCCIETSERVRISRLHPITRRI